jgi:hypothetical protein
MENIDNPTISMVRTENEGQQESNSFDISALSAMNLSSSTALTELMTVLNQPGTQAILQDEKVQCALREALSTPQAQAAMAEALQAASVGKDPAESMRKHMKDLAPIISGCMLQCPQLLVLLPLVIKVCSSEVPDKEVTKASEEEAKAKTIALKEERERKKPGEDDASAPSTSREALARAQQLHPHCVWKRVISGEVTLCMFLKSWARLMRHRFYHGGHRGVKGVVTNMDGSINPDEAFQAQLERAMHESILVQCASQKIRSTGLYSSKLVRDLTASHQTAMSPGKVFHQKWLIENDGDLAWPAGTRLIFIGGEALAVDFTNDDADSNILLHGSGHLSGIHVPCVPPHSRITLSLRCRAPSTLGRYLSYWRLAVPDGEFSSDYESNTENMKEEHKSPAPSVTAANCDHEMESAVMTKVSSMEESCASGGYTNIVNDNATDTENNVSSDDHCKVDKQKKEIHHLSPSNHLSEFGEPIFLRTIVVNTISHQTKELSEHTWRSIKEVANDVSIVVSDVSHEISKSFRGKKSSTPQQSSNSYASEKGQTLSENNDLVVSLPSSALEEVHMLSEDDDLVVSPPSSACVDEPEKANETQQCGIEKRQKQEIQNLSLSSIAGNVHLEDKSVEEEQFDVEIVESMINENRITSLAVPDVDWDIVESNGIPANTEMSTPEESEKIAGPKEINQRHRSLSSSSGSIFAYQDALDAIVAMGFVDSPRTRAILIAEHGQVEQTLNALLN